MGSMVLVYHVLGWRHSLSMTPIMFYRGEPQYDAVCLHRSAAWPFAQAKTPQLLFVTKTGHKALTFTKQEVIGPPHLFPFMTSN